jgi:hypothetical protein
LAFSFPRGWQDGDLHALGHHGLAALADQHLYGARCRLPLHPFLVALPLLFYFLCAEFFSTLGT